MNPGPPEYDAVAYRCISFDAQMCKYANEECVNMAEHPKNVPQCTMWDLHFVTGHNMAKVRKVSYPC